MKVSNSIGKYGANDTFHNRNALTKGGQHSMATIRILEWGRKLGKGTCWQYFYMKEVKQA